jgi:TorA maturation chaperone TorD
MNCSLSLLSRLWLREPDSRLLAEARETQIFADIRVDPAELACAYSELFLMNVYPYGSVWTDPSGELNAPSTSELSTRYEEAGFAPAEIFEVAAPDHVGLCLAFLGHLRGAGRDAAGFSAELLEWVPLLAIAVCREASVHPFYRAVARATVSTISAEASPERAAGRGTGALPVIAEEEEIGLSQVVGFLLAPARSGFFLSRSRLGELAREAGLALSFGSRFDVARSLFLASGQTGTIPRLLDLLEREVSEWESEIADLARREAAWQAPGALWQSLLAGNRARLAELRRSLDTAFEVLYEDPARAPREA